MGPSNRRKNKEAIGDAESSFPTLEYSIWTNFNNSMASLFHCQTKVLEK